MHFIHIEKTLFIYQIPCFIDVCLMANDIWNKQNGEIHETKDKIYLGVYKHSLLNNIITDKIKIIEMVRSGALGISRGIDSLEKY